MKIALVNPHWNFEGSVYFGCKEPHLPLEFGYARALLEAAGHEAKLFDCQLEELDLSELRVRVSEFSPDVSVVTTAPSYLFWRCAPPELGCPMRSVRALRDVGGSLVIVGPHASTTPRAVLSKLGADAAVLGECEEALLAIAESGADYAQVPGVAYVEGGTARGSRFTLQDVVISGGPRASDVNALPALRWEHELVSRHRHHHHRFERAAEGPGAELEASRGCPYQCSFCAKQNFRDRLRKRPLEVVLDELDALLAQGVRYVYFIDEIFLPRPDLLEALVERDVAFGVQLRIDNWSFELLELLGRAGCVSIEAGVESVTREGRSLLHKACKLSTEELSERLIFAKQHVPFVQANLIGSGDSGADVQAFRGQLEARGVWSNEPVPLFPYPGSPEYGQRWGAPDDLAWERAHAAYLREFSAFSELQEHVPRSLPSLEAAP